MTKRKPKPWNPGRPTIKSLQGQIVELQRQLTNANNGNDYSRQTQRNAEERMKQIAAENESLRADKKWLQQLVQHLTVPETTNHTAIPRLR